MKSISKELIGASAGPIILSVLRNGDNYGYDIVLKVKPGITDKASIQFRNEEDILAQSTNPDLTYKEVILPQKLDINISYVNNRSFFMDLDIILNTLLAIVRK